MNIVVIDGNLVSDCGLKLVGDKEIHACNNVVAVRRDFKSKNGEYGTDFVPISALGQTADYMVKYAKKGSQVIVKGQFKQEMYVKDGTKYNSYNVFVESIKIINPKEIYNKDNEETEKPKSEYEALKMVETQPDDLPF